MITSVHHISISVKEIHRSTEFYAKLGFEEKLVWNSTDRSLIISHLKLGDVCLELFCYTNCQEMPETANELSTDLPRIGVKHLGIKVNSIDEANDFLLNNKIISAKQKVNMGKTGVRYFFIKDPDGILLEFVEDNRNF